MLAGTNLRMMLPEQFAADHLAILRHDADQAIVVLRVVADEFGQFLQLPLQAIKPPLHILQALVHTPVLRLGQRGHHHITLHRHPFNSCLIVLTGTLRVSVS